jgi:2-polyprenyl-3-methyl-5-hydroxy-6-metoxy-1,4-benzoquinol methylase
MTRRNERKKHGWFVIPGIQTGERDLKERIKPLRPLLKYAKGASILDVGSAEGCISKWLIQDGRAKSAHLIEKHAPFLATARQIMPPPFKVKFTLADLHYWFEEKDTYGLNPKGYDIVLALNVIQKERRAREVLHDLANMANKIFVYSGPSPVLTDPRSGLQEIDVREELKKDFSEIHFDPGARHSRKGHLGIRLIFKRKST